ncbi:RNA-directed DNA polymerase, eukaryota, reverse transcriptase zinc-binding domain protein [Tanacetum coccineum]
MDIIAISCPSCNANVESANHIFFECNTAKDVWSLVNNWCEISLPLVTSFEEHQVRSSSWNVSKNIKHKYYVISASVLWWLWRFRNSVTFNSHPLRKSDLSDNVRSTLFSWLHNRDHMNLSWNAWLMSPLSIVNIDNG